MSIKYSYEPGMCKATHYNGLWPVKYEGTSGLYKKIEMVCSCGINGCKDDCEVFENAPEIYPMVKEWLMKDKQYESIRW